MRIFSIIWSLMSYLQVCQRLKGKRRAAVKPITLYGMILTFGGIVRMHGSEAIPEISSIQEKKQL